MQSMTGFAEVTGADATCSWRWEARGVNGRGFDLRLRLPDGSEALDPILRGACQKHLARGTVNISLRVTRTAAAGAGMLDEAALARGVAMLTRAEEAAMAAGLALQPTTADRLLLLPGVMAQADAEPLVTAARRAVFETDIERLVADFAAARRAEGAALASVIRGQLDEIARLVAAARATAEARNAAAGGVLEEKVAALLGAGAADPQRLAQELALLAVRADVTEELDRLDAHVAAAARLIEAGGPVGRKFDFLMQEFNREANTLCSKSGSEALTRIGLDLKVTIDQLREQIQNVE